MRKKLQVFVSSTFIDLKEERQASVEAILSAGHIPAGMELFKAGSDSQLQTIKRWIDESDVYMLILGGRYGSIEEKSGKSYTHLEYDYAVNKGMPVFAIVITQNALDKKVREAENYRDVTEQDNPDKLKRFRDEEVLQRMSAFFDDIKDIKLETINSLNEIIQTKPNLSGWVSGKDVANPEEYIKSLSKLTEENTKLRNELDAAKSKILKLDKDKEQSFNGLTYDEIKSVLIKEKISIPNGYFGQKKDTEINYLTGFITFRDDFATGISNTQGMTDNNNFIFFRIAPKLINLGLLERVKLTGTRAYRIQTSKLGDKFLAFYDVKSTGKQKEA